MVSPDRESERRPQFTDACSALPSLSDPALAGSQERVSLPVFPDPQEHLESFFSRCPSPIVQADLAGFVTSWNPAAAQFYGYSSAEMIGRHVSMLAPAAVASDVQRQVEILRAGRVVEPFETIALTRDGQRIDVSITIFPVFDADGHCVGSGSITQDISARKQAALALAASEQRFRAAFDITPAAMSLVGLDGCFIQVNRMTCAMLGYTENEMRRMSIADVLLPEDATPDPGAELLRRAMNPEFNPELRLVRRDGSVCWVHLAVGVMVDEQGQPASFLIHGHDLTEQRAAQTRLATLRAQFHDVIDRAGAALVDLDGSWRILRTNVAAEALFPGVRAPLVGQLLQEVLDPATLSDFAGFLTSALRDQRPVQIAEYFSQSLQIWVSVQITPTPEGLSLHVRDITAQRNVEDSLRQVEARFEVLVANLPATVFMHGITAAEQILFLSPYFAVMTGYSVEHGMRALATDGWLSLIHPDDRGQVISQAAVGLRGEGKLTMEFRLRCASGRYIWVESSASLVRSDDGRPMAWLGILTDVTGKREARLASARLASIVESAEDIIYSRTTDGVITSWNPGAERITGYPAEVAIGQTLTDLFPLDNVQLLSLRDLESMSAGMRFNARFHRADGESVDLAMAVTRLNDEVGNVIGVSTIGRDITAQLAVERELRAALEAAEAGERTKALFLAMMSHELRTPLQSVLGYADLLLGGASGALTSAQREDVGAIHAGATRMVSLIRQMLDLSWMEAGRLDLKSEVMDLTAILTRIHATVLPQAQAQGLSLRLDSPPPLPEVLGDPERLRQILDNLIDNALRFTEAGGVRISARVRGDWVDLAVEDTGSGIRDAELPFIFESFRQDTGRLSRRSGGAGLGLAIAQRLARQMEGDVTVDTRVGAGSTFTLSLPTAAALRARWREPREEDANL
ncbi:MAG: PAS domain S-box protein [Thermomicrobiales bacterium]